MTNCAHESDEAYKQGYRSGYKNGYDHGFNKGKTEQAAMIKGPTTFEGEMLRVSTDDGKYTVIQHKTGTVVLRYGETWRDVTGDGLILALAYGLEEARNKAAKLGKEFDEFKQTLQEPIE